MTRNSVYRNAGAKDVDIVGLYLDPPQNASCCLDAKSQIQTLNRTRRRC